MRISAIYRHTGYNDVTNENDVALLRLATSVDLSVHTPICMPSPTFDLSGLDGWVYGWGSTSQGGAQADNLQVYLDWDEPIKT